MHPLKLFKLDYLFIFFIFIISSLLAFELFSSSGKPATFDANIHMTSIAQFGEALKSGNFPVVWLNNYSNYGSPVGLYTHQLPNYLGGIINVFIQNPPLTYNLLIFVAIFLSNIFLYLFLKLYFNSYSSFLGIFVFNFTQYRIFDIYVRGALPEVFSGIFLPLILISLFLLIVKQKKYAFFLLALLIAGLTLNHPMMLFVYSAIFIPYFLFLLITQNLSKRNKTKLFLTVTLSMLLGIFISGYYVLPFAVELRYFYIGLTKNNLATNSFLSLSNFFNVRWDYFARGEIIQFGLLETLTLIFGFLYYTYKKFIQKSKENLSLLKFILILAVFLIFLTTSFSNFLYEKIFFLNSIQFPWRFLSGLIFLPAILIAFFYERFPKKNFFVTIIIFVCIFSFPQIYGKNYTKYPLNSYYSNKDNLYSIMMTTVWAGRSQDYPPRKNQGFIVEGKGQLLSEEIHNSSRSYIFNAATPLKIADNTFYFPGWHAYLDGKRINIEYQNPDFRGMITYIVPSGKHNIYLVFEDTIVRFLGKVISLISIAVFAVVFLLRKRYIKFLQ